MRSFYDWRNKPSDSHNSKQGRPRRGLGRGPMFEALEQRCLLSFLDIASSGSGSAEPGPLTYVESGTPSPLPNELSVVSTGANGSYTIVDLRQTITLSATAIALGWTGSGTNTVTGPVSSVTSIAISSSNEQVNNLTIGSIDAPTTVTGFQAVNLGQAPAGGGASSLSGIRQSVAIGVQTGQTTPTALTLDDSGGTVGQNWTIAPTSVSGASPGAISWTAGQINQLNIQGGSGNNVFNVNDTSATTSLNPGTGSDSITILATTNPLTINSQGGGGSDTVTLTGGRAIAGALSLTGDTGQIGLTVSADTTGASLSPTLRAGQLTGLTPQPIQFGAGTLSLLNYNGGAGDDTLTVDFSAGNPIPASGGLFYDGGLGFNTLVLQGGSFTNQTYRAFGSTNGSITLDGSFIGFNNLSPIIDTVPAVNYTFTGPDNLVVVNVVPGPISQGFQTTEINSGDTPVGFELVDFANKTNVTIDLTGIEPFAPPGQVITLNTPTAATGLATLSLFSGISDDQINVVATAPGVANLIESGPGNDQISVRAAGLGAGGSNSFDGDTGIDTLTIDAGGAAVSFTATSVSVAGSAPITLTNIERVNIINAANPPLAPIPASINGTAGRELNDVVGRFTDTDPTELAANFIATIDWGDDTPATAGTVSLPSGTGSPFEVSGSHTYASAGTYPVTVQVVNPPNTSTTVLGGVTFAVSDLGGAITIDSVANIVSPGVNATPIPITVVEDQTFTQALATFTVPEFPVEPPPSDVFYALAIGEASFTATIDWGDGTAPSAGTVRLAGDGVYVVEGTHLYLRESAPGRPYLVTITIVDSSDFATTVTTTATVLSNDIVTTEADSGPGSLRAVIDDVNADQIPATITFNIPGAGPHRIVPTSPLPMILYPVDIDGTSQPGFQGSPVIEVSGGLAGPAANGLALNGGDSTVRSLVINRFGGIGLLLQGGGGYRVIGNRIGTDLSGTQAAGNETGLQIFNSGGNTIGGTTPAERNIISGNRSIGLSLAGSGAIFNHVMGNYIGTDVTGQSAVPNFQGVVMLGAGRNLIGGVGAGMGNLISGNASAGLQIFNDATVFNGQPLFNPPGVASGNVIQGNLIGTDAQGTGRLGNAQGIFINDASANVIGGADPGAGNVIAGNRSIGIQILGDNATGNVILGNFIGTNRAGDRGLGNSVGVFLYAQTGNFVAPEGTPGGNVIRFNTSGKVETRPLADGPQVERASLLRASSGATTGIGMVFTTYLNNQRAENPANYIVSMIGRNFRPGRRVRVASVSYDEINRIVTVIFASPIPRNASFRLRVVGTAPNGLSDRSGNFLDGNPDVVRQSTGSDFQADFIQGVQVQTQTPVRRGPRRVRGLGMGGRAIGGLMLGRGRFPAH